MAVMLFNSSARAAVFRVMTAHEIQYHGQGWTAHELHRPIAPKLVLHKVYRLEVQCVLWRALELYVELPYRRPQ